MKKLTLLLVLLPYLAISQVKIDVTYRVLEASYITLNVADYVLTVHGLNNGAYEMNPIAEKMNPYSMAGLKLASTATVLILGRVAYKHNPKAAKITMLAMNVITGLVVTNNIKVILKIN